MRRVLIAVSVWTGLFAGLYLAMFLTSEGEPVCEGPLILSGSDSLPPQCPGPLETIPTALIIWLLGAAIIWAIGRLVIAIRSSGTA